VTHVGFDSRDAGFHGISVSLVFRYEALSFGPAHDVTVSLPW
jgi:hypothetical protein